MTNLLSLNSMMAVMRSFGNCGLGLTLAGLAAGWSLAAVAERLLTALLYAFPTVL